MNDERKTLWKETYNKKVETMSVRKAAAEADDVVSEWNKRNLFSDQFDPLRICHSGDIHHHLRMQSIDPIAAKVRVGQTIRFWDYEQVDGEVSRVIRRGTGEALSTIFEIVISRTDPPKEATGTAINRHAGDVSFSAYVIEDIIT